MPSFFAAHPGLLIHLLEAARTMAWLIVAIVVFGPLEHFFSVRKAPFFHKGWSTNLVWYFVNSVVPVFLLGPPMALIAWAIHSVLPGAFTSAAGYLPIWARMVLAMVVGEVGFYWGHRWSHEWPLL